MGRTVFRSYPILGGPKAVSPVGGKGATKVLKQKPLGTDPHLTISKRSSECWLLIGHNYCPPPNRRTASPECAWVCSYSTAIVSPFSIVLVRFVQGCAVQQKPSFSTLLSRKGTTDDSGKRSAEPFQFARLSLFPPRPLFAYPSLSRLPHSFASSSLSESLEQAKELEELVRSVRTRYACNFQDTYSFAIS